MAELTFQQIVQRIFQRQGGWARLKGELAVYYWPRVAGPELAGKMTAVRFREGNLYLTTDNPALAHQVSLLNYDILQRFQKLLGRGVVKSIKIKIGPVAAPPVPPVEAAPPQLAEGAQSFIGECSGPIADPDLAAQFQKFMAHTLLKNERTLQENGTRCQSCNTVIAPDHSFCPCCERQMHQEIREYLEYLQITQGEAPPEIDLRQLAESHQILIRQLSRARASQEKNIPDLPET